MKQNCIEFQNYIEFKEGSREYTWFYENILGDNGLIEGLRELYNCWTISIEKVVIGSKVDDNWYDWL